jgi:2-keto-4-pentenoate hydratase/2-oxohepta-3-ene-1,7-dioic acid hydratase in catechol pathway
LTFEPAPVVLAPTTTGESFPVRRLFCIGRNYAAHAREMGKDPDREPPFFFTSWAETVVPDGSIIAYPQATSDYQHEIELVIAIGRSGRNVSKEDALGLVYGYAVGLDMTRRDLQFIAREAGRPWDAGKIVEESKPLGPIHPAAGFNEANGAVTLTVNGVAPTLDLILPAWTPGSYMIREYARHFVTVRAASRGRASIRAIRPNTGSIRCRGGSARGSPAPGRPAAWPRRDVGTRPASGHPNRCRRRWCSRAARW